MIWHLVDSSTIGGIESHVAALSAALRTRGIDATIVLYAGHGQNPWLEQLGRAGLPYRVLPGSLVSLCSALAAERPSILHTHGYKASILGRIAAVPLGVPVVSTFHAGERGRFPVSLYQQLDAWTAFTATRLAVSEAIAARLPFKAEVVPNFVLPVGDARRDSPRSVGFVGRLSHEKGPDLFCEIAAASDESIDFHVFGDGPMRDALEAAHAPRVRFHGLQQDMSLVWPQIGLLLMPSRAEGLPMAALESLANGVPVVATRVGALPRIVVEDRTGWLFEPGDATTALRRIAAWFALSDEERRRIAEACQREALVSFGPDRPVERLIAIYGERSRHRIGAPASA